MDVCIKAEIVLTEDSIRLVPTDHEGARRMDFQFGIPRDPKTGKPARLEEVMAQLPKWVKDRFMDNVGWALNRARVT